MEFKEITFKKGYYNEICEVTTTFPDVPWVECDIVFDEGLHIGHTNYWTIIPDTISNRRWIINTRKNHYAHSEEIFNGIILITLNDVAPIPEFNIIPWEELYNKYHLDKLTIVTYNKNFDISSVNKVLEIQHPEFATIKSFDFLSLSDQKIINSGIHNHVNLIKICYPFHGTSKILSGEKAKEVWNDAMTKFLYDFGESNIPPKLQYESEYNPDESLKENIIKVIKITNQFK